MKKLIYAIVTLLALMIGGLLTVPSLVDWNRFKAPIADSLRAALGRTVMLAGDVRFTMLPTPTLSIGDVGIANPPGAVESRLLRLGRLDVRVALLPLFGGRLDIQTIILERPTLVLETLTDGRRGWLVPSLRPATGAPPPEGVEGGGTVRHSVRFDQIEVRDGALEWRDDGAGTVARVTGINGHLTAGGLAGPFELQGGATIEGAVVAVEAATGTLGVGATMPIRMTLTVPDDGAHLHFAGLVAVGAAPRLQGEVRAEAIHPAETVAVLAKLRGVALAVAGLPLALRQPLSVRGTLDASEGSATLGNLEVHLGETVLTGGVRVGSAGPTGTAALPNVEVSLALSRIELESWAMPVPSGSGVGGFTLPTTFTARLELAVDTLGLPRGALRQAKLAAHLADGALTLERFAIQGPGGSNLALTGRFDTTATIPAFEATVSVAADNPRRALEWLQVDLGDIASDRPGRFGLTARLLGRPGTVEANAVDVRLDTSHATGSLLYRWDALASTRPALTVRFDLDHIDADAYRGAPHQDGGQTAKGYFPATLAPALEAAVKTVTAAVDGTVVGHVGHLAIVGEPLRDIDIDVDANPAGLTLRRLRLATPGGTIASLQGKLAGLVPLEGVDLAFTTEVGANDTGFLTRLFGLSSLSSPPRLDGLRIEGQARGDGRRLLLALTAERAGGRVEAAGGVAPDAGRLLEPLRLHAVFPETGPLIRWLSPDAPASTGPELGLTDLSGSLSFDRDQATVSEIQGTVAGVTVEGRLHADLTGPRPWLEVRGAVGDLDLDRLMPNTAASAPIRRSSLWPGGATPPARYRWSMTPFDLDWLSRADGQLALTATTISARGQRLTAAVVRASLRDAALRLEQFDGDLMGGRLSAIGRLAATAKKAGSEMEPDVALTVTLSGAQVEEGVVAISGTPAAFDITAGHLDLDLNLSGHGDSEMALIGALSGTGRLAVTNGRFRGLDLPGLEQRIISIRKLQDVTDLLNLERGETAVETAFDRLQGTLTFDHGIASTNDVQLIAATGTGDAQGFVDLPNRTLNFGMHFRSRHQPPLPAIGVTLTGSLDHPHRAIDTSDLQRVLMRKLTGGVTSSQAPAPPGAIVPGAGGAGGFLRGLFRDPPTTKP